MSESAARYGLPSRSVFEPPSYPNVWFYVHDRLAASQDAAVSFVTGWLREQCGITNDFGHWKPPEASDSQAWLGGLQPWQGGTDPALHHAHDLHIRYYYVALRQTGKHHVTLRGAAGVLNATTGSRGACTTRSQTSTRLTRTSTIALTAAVPVPTPARTISLPESTNHWVWNCSCMGRFGVRRWPGPMAGLSAVCSS